MSLDAPIVPEIKQGPQGTDTVAVFLSSDLTLTYWDLWALLAAKHCFDGSLPSLRASLLERRLHGPFRSMHRNELLEDIMALCDDLILRTQVARASVDEILQHLPEKLLKKELRKGIKNITDSSGSNHRPSEPMLRSPRRLLEAEAMRGMWEHLPVNPTPFADRLEQSFLPPPKSRFIEKEQSFVFARKIAKAVKSELKNAGELGSNPRASHYAVFRAALTLYHEVHAWDDSYGVIGENGIEWMNEVISTRPSDVDADPEMFLKDLLMFLCWEDYGLSEVDVISNYVTRLAPRDADIAIQILKDIHHRATQAFQKYKAQVAERALNRLEAPILTPTLSLVKAIHGADAKPN